MSSALPASPSVPTEGHDAAVLDWKETADALCAEMMRRAPAQIEKVADDLYETLLNTVQVYLRENIDYNLSADLLRAKNSALRANNALQSVANEMGVDTYGFPNYPTPEMIADRCVETFAKATGASA